MRQCAIIECRPVAYAAAILPSAGSGFLMSPADDAQILADTASPARPSAAAARARRARPPGFRLRA